MVTIPPAPFSNEVDAFPSFQIPIDISVKKKYIMIRAQEHSNELLVLLVNGKQLLTAKIGQKGICRIRKTSKDGKRLIRTLQEGKRITAIKY